MPARLRSALPIGVAALACVVAVAACGGSSKPKHPNSHETALFAVSKCMRAHGVPNFPDPVNGGGIHLSGSFDTQSPAFKAAQGICFRLMPGRGTQRASATTIADARNTAQCMREHGVTNFPDPIVTDKPPYELNLNPADYGEITAGGGLVIAIPISINERSPAYVKAAKVCGFQR